ncbi:unnamed protein product, partial [Prorocentrum cordatum]
RRRPTGQRRSPAFSKRGPQERWRAGCRAAGECGGLAGLAPCAAGATGGAHEGVGGGGEASQREAASQRALALHLQGRPRAPSVRSRGRFPRSPPPSSHHPLRVAEASSGEKKEGAGTDARLRLAVRAGKARGDEGHKEVERGEREEDSEQEGEEKKDDKDPLEHLAEPSAQYPYGLENPERSLEPSRNALACMTSSCADIGTLGNRPARTTKKISRPFRTMGWKGVARRMSPRVA